MRDMTSMAVVVGERERPSPKVWQPWYMEESEGGVGGKELPSRALRDQRTRERLAIPRPPHRPAASPERECSSEDEINVVDSPPPTTYYSHSYYGHMDEGEDEDLPLDMSTKRRSPITVLPARTTNSPSPPPYHPRPAYLPPPARPRPSVITCVPPRYLDPAHMPPHRELPPPYTDRHIPPPPYSVATAHLNQQRATREHITPISRPLVTPPPANPAHRDPPRPDEPPVALRQVVQAGPVDPEIDEHFRRSLGKDYQQLFTAPPAPSPSTDSVDDHFAKALGETWVKLQAERRDNTTITTTAATTTTTTTTAPAPATTTTTTTTTLPPPPPYPTTTTTISPSSPPSRLPPPPFPTSSSPSRLPPPPAPSSSSPPSSPPSSRPLKSPISSSSSPPRIMSA